MISALVFPGGGQFYLGKRWRALVFALPTLAAAVYFLSGILEQATDVAYGILDGRVAPQIGAIMSEASRISKVSGWPMTIAAAVMIACWAASTLDAWLLARRPM